MCVLKYPACVPFLLLCVSFDVLHKQTHTHPQIQKKANEKKHVHLCDMLNSMKRNEHIFDRIGTFLFVHFSVRYSRDEILKNLRRMLPDVRIFVVFSFFLFPSLYLSLSLSLHTHTHTHTHTNRVFGDVLFLR